MLQRIYGTAWESRKALKAFLQLREEALKRDHRKLGRELDLFSSPDELGPGLFLWHPNGATIRNELIKHAEALHTDYQSVVTPHLAKGGLWETSGHLAKFAENMYPPMTVEEGNDYYVKPMNCPFHVFIYGSQTRSYRDLPIRLFELGTVYRWEKSGVLTGMLRLRGLTQDDSHIFCTEDQLVDELLGAMVLLEKLFEPFDFSDAEIHLSTNPGEAIGTPEMWEKATGALRNALDRSGKTYQVAEGEGAFYGPKIDFHFRDAIGRLWQLTTIQCDFALPERFDLSYIGEDGEKHRPVMVHRALYGAIERFFAVLTEHYAGAFPTWLAPTQVEILPITDSNEPYSSSVEDALKAAGVRARVVGASDTLGNRIRKATTQKVPYMVIIGPKEEESKTLSVRKRTGEETKGGTLDEFVTQIAEEIKRKSG
jgi:threonyl-tRNA synthetase